MGTGHTSRKTNEQMLYAIKGAGLKRADRGVFAPRPQHSEKPEAATAALEQLFGSVRRLELFARKHRDGRSAGAISCRVASKQPKPNGESP
jgi:N6-adenosine-specific RNA methylase IME4